MKKFYSPIACVYLIFSAMLLTRITVQAQPVLTFRNISTAQGLSINNASCILQDRKGFIWVGTRDGLNRYNGYTFDIFRNDPRDRNTISSNFIWCLAEDREGNIWAGTIEGGLNKYEYSTGRFIRYTYDAHHPDGISDNTVQSILEDSHGQLWIGTQDGLDMFDREKNIFVHYRHDPKDPNSLANDKIFSIFEDSKGRLWIGTRTGGLDLFDRDKRSFRHFVHDPANPRSISDDGILSIYEDRDHDLWIGTDSRGLNLFHPATGTFTHWEHRKGDLAGLSNNTIRCISEDDKGYLWLGTENGGLNLFDKKKNLFYTYRQDDKNFIGVNSNSIWDICRDRAGNTWMATFSDGLEFLDGQPEKFACYSKQPHNSAGLSNNNVNAFCEDGAGDIWIGTDGGGINVFQPKTNSFSHYRSGTGPGSLSNDVILSIREGRNGNFFIGTFRGGLNELKDPKTARFIEFPIDTVHHHGIGSDIVGCTLQDPKGNWYIGTWEGGLDYYDPHANTFNHFPITTADHAGISNSSVQAMLMDSVRNLWLGTMGGGLNLLPAGSKRFEYFRHDEKDKRSLSNDIINCLLQDAKGRLWVGTQNGLNLFDRRTQTFSKYFQKDGLPNNVIEGMLEDRSGRLWISTNNGISCFDPSAGTFRNYEYNDGLQGAVFNRNSCLTTRDGHMYFGGSRGFNVFHPDSIRANTVAPPVYITGFEVFNKPVGPEEEGSPLARPITVAQEITLSYKQSVFSFEFAALNYSLQEKNQYAYKMEGFDQDWNMVGTQRKATYTNLDPGVYTFRVKASNNDGVWNEKGTAIRVIITPPFWATWWFRGLMGLLLIAAVLVSYRLRINAIRAEKKKLEERVIELDKAVAQGKFEIASDVLHDIGNAMVGLGSCLTRIQRSQQQDIPETLSKLTRFFASQRSAMVTAIGEQKAEALVTMLTGLEGTYKKNNEVVGQSVAEQFNIIAHIQGILDIQRQYIMGNRSQERKPVDVGTIVKDCMSMLSSSMAKNNISVVTEIPSGVPLIKGDRTRLMQVFLHLLRNSVEAIGDQLSQRRISISIRQQSGLLHVQLADSGQGIDNAIRERLFEKGFTTRPSAAGLGLYNSLNIMESHEGTLHLHSEGPGKGATATIQFKLG